MDIDVYEQFRKLMGTPETYAEPKPEQLANCKALVGDAIAEIVRVDGFAFYKDQRIRTVDPAAFSAVSSLWLIDGEPGEIFLITCFGDFFCWRRGFCWFVNVNEHFAVELIDSLEWFLASFLQAKGYFPSLFEGFSKAKSIIKRAPLAYDEMLAWTPALALGGSRAASALERAKILEGHAILSGLGELRLHRY